MKLTRRHLVAGTASVAACAALPAAAAIAGQAAANARSQREFLDLIPEPDEAFRRAARNAVVQQFGEEMADELDRIARRSMPRRATT